LASQAGLEMLQRGGIDCIAAALEHLQAGL